MISYIGFYLELVSTNQETKPSSALSSKQEDLSTKSAVTKDKQDDKSIDMEIDTKKYNDSKLKITNHL